MFIKGKLYTAKAILNNTLNNTPGLEHSPDDDFGLDDFEQTLIGYYLNSTTGDLYNPFSIQAVEDTNLFLYVDTEQSIIKIKQTTFNQNLHKFLFEHEIVCFIQNQNLTGLK